jgi:protein O-GlcNAc transferase
MTIATDLQSAFSLHQQGRFQDALTYYNRVLAAAPGHAQALGASALALHELGMHDTAAERLTQLLHADPTNAQNWAQLAMAYEAQGRLDDAVAALKRAAQYNDTASEAWISLASIQLAAGYAQDAEAASRKATELAPMDGAAWFNLALSLQMQGRLAEGLTCVTEASRLAPDAAPPAGLKAQIQASLGMIEAARSTVQAALARHGRIAALYVQAAEIELRQGRIGEAARYYESALQLDPNDTVVAGELLFLRKRLADWHDLDALRTKLRSGIQAHRALSPFVLLSEPFTRAEQSTCAQRWSARFGRSREPDTRPPISSDRLHIGYLSADFHQHATAVLTAGLFESHDARAFKVTGYSTGADDGSPMRGRLQKALHTFVDVHDWPAGRLAERIRADGIDILVDLKGHTDNARTDVLALRPAPIQVNYLGYPGTMGATFIDYLIGDRVVTPFDHAPDYCETLVQLPSTYQVNDSERPIIAPPPRGALGLPETAMVFCCFNSAFKFNPGVVDAWAHILRESPGSVLWLLAGADDPRTDTFAINFRREVASRGVAPSRLVFAQRRDYAEYLGLYMHADLFLDTWPYNAHTTASDALWAACPVLTCIGDTFAARVAASLLLAVGRPELIAPSVAHYIQQAIDLASDRPALARHRAYLADAGRRSVLFDTRRTTRSLEAAYREMAAQYRRGERAAVRISLQD